MVKDQKKEEQRREKDQIDIRGKMEFKAQVQKEENLLRESKEEEKRTIIQKE